MAESYDDANRDAVPPELDEYICEYVDGTMDPAVREAFEEYLEANPSVASHVECLKEATAILKACADQCPCVADDFQSRLKCAVEHECGSAEASGQWLDRITGVVLATSAVTLFCLAVLAPHQVMEAFSDEYAGTRIEDRAATDRYRDDPLSGVRYHVDRPAMVRLGPSTPVPPAYAGLRLQPTYRDLSANARYLAASVSP